MAQVVDDYCACLSCVSICSGGSLHGVSMGPNGVAPAGGMTVSAVPRLPTRSSNSSDHSEGATPARTGAPPPGRPSFPNDAYRQLPYPLSGILGKKTVFFELFGRFLSAFLRKSLPRNINDCFGRFRFSHNAGSVSFLDFYHERL